MEQNPVSQNMIDTTDSLEATNVFKSMKNFTFWLIILSMLVLLGVFLMARFGWIEESQVSRGDTTPFISFSQARASGGLFSLAAQPGIPEAGETETEAANQTEEAQEQTYDPIERQAREVTGQDEPAGEEAGLPEVEEPLRAEPRPDGPGEPFIDWKKVKLTPKQAVLMIRIFNYICLISAILYSLTLMFALKVSLTGRLGGIRHISRAFFISLFAFVFLFPWQAILPSVLIGAIYLPAELIGDQSWLADGADMSNALLLLRFIGLWLAVFFLYFWAQLRSMKWARATLRRLGVMR